MNHRYHHHRYAATDECAGTTTDYRQRLPRYNDDPDRAGRLRPGGRCPAGDGGGASGDERWRPAASREAPSRRPYKKFSPSRKLDGCDKPTVGGSPGDGGGGPVSSPPPCYRETYRRPTAAAVDTGGESVGWDAMCSHFARLNRNENKFKKGYPSTSIPQNHHLQYYNGLHQFHQMAYASRNTHASNGKKQRPPPPVSHSPVCCNPWQQWTPYNRPVHAFTNKYCLSAPDMYSSHGKDVALDDSQTVLDEDDQLSASVWRMYIDSRQSERVYDTKMAMWRRLSSLIKSRAPDCGLYMVGSTMNGFGGDVSDADFCLLTGCTAAASSADVRHRLCGVERLRWLMDLLEYERQHCSSGFGATDVHVVYAKVPILRFRWQTADDEGGDGGINLDVDLCCNHVVGIRNTHLLYCYSRLDYRVRPLVLTIKRWASYHNINDPKKMTLSSYSLVLMVINFLQCVVPVVVPSLQHIYGMKFSVHTDIEFVHMHEKLPRNSWKSDNKQSLGELLLQFFEYYNNFNFCKKAVSVRTGGLLLLEQCRMAETAKNDPGQWKFIGIEEPFERTNTARSVHNHNVFNQIKDVISKSYDNLKSNKSLESIFCKFEL